VKANPTGITCNTGTCASTECCENDATLCGGAGVVACTTANTHYWDPTKAGIVRTANGGTAGTNCCSAKATCASFGCSAGYKLKGTPATI
jgi:hypothetical protein